MKFKNIFLIILLIIHTSWISFHLYLVSQEKINPWKLAGYGMYTTPAPLPALKVYKRNKDQTLEKIPGKKLERESYNKMNWQFNYYCKKIRAKQLNQFFTDNPDLIGTNINLIVKAKSLKKNPIDEGVKRISTVKINWIGLKEYTYSVEHCQGKTYDGKTFYKK